MVMSVWLTKFNLEIHIFFFSEKFLPSLETILTAEDNS